MITLNNFTKLDNGQYQMTLFMKNTDSQKDLPSAVRPMSPEYFAVTVDYGIPAEGSIAIKEGGGILTYSSGKWGRAETSENIKLQELSVEENGEYVPEDGYAGFNKVVVDVKPKVIMPTKGDLIIINEKQYRVLKIDNTVAEVLTIIPTINELTIGEINTYENSTLDTYCNDTFYNTLPVVMQNAITDKSFAQDSWYSKDGVSATIGNPQYIGYYESYRDGPTNYVCTQKVQNIGNRITRHCYAISVQDIIDYLDTTPEMNVDNTTLTSDNIKIMFAYSAETNPNTSWTRSQSFVENPSSSLPEFGYMCQPMFDYGDVCNGITTRFSGAVRPAFQIDLSKIEWSKSE